MTTRQRRLPFAGFAIFFCATSAWAQSKILQGDIPFPFHIGEQHFNAGNYDVHIGKPYLRTATIRLSDDAKPVAMTYYYEDQTQDSTALQSKLVFNKYGTDEYFLSQIWHPGVSTSMKLLQSKHELVTSKLVTGIRPENVVIWAAVRLPR